MFISEGEGYYNFFTTTYVTLKVQKLLAIKVFV